MGTTSWVESCSLCGHELRVLGQKVWHLASTIVQRKVPGWTTPGLSHNRARAHCFYYISKSMNSHLMDSLCVPDNAVLAVLRVPERALE